MNELKRRLSELGPEQRSLLRDRMEGTESSGRTPAGIPRRAGAEAVSLSFAQERIWVHQQMAPSDPRYNRPVCLLLRGPLEVEALRRAVELLLGRHDALRGAVREENGQPFLELPAAGPGLGFELEWSDVSGTSDPGARAEAWLAEDAARPLELGRPPLIRGRLVRLAAAEHWLILIFHHLIFDGGSEGIVREDLAELYRSVVTGTAPSLPWLPLGFADFTAWDRSGERRAGLSAGRAYWSEQL